MKGTLPPVHRGPSIIVQGANGITYTVDLVRGIIQTRHNGILEKVNFDQTVIHGNPQEIAKKFANATAAEL